MTRSHSLMAIGIACAAAGCAASPRDIAPAYVSPVIYQSWSCQQLSAEGYRLVSALSDASSRQENARTGDAVAVLLVGLPLSSMSGQNVAPEVAKLKGEHEAVYKAAIERGCAIQPTNQITNPPSSQIITSATH